jgi:hypothetical protein
MKQEILLGVACVSTAIPQGAFSYESLQLVEYTGKRADFGRINPDGSFVFLTEREWATESLQQGKGIVYQGYVYFLEKKLEESEYYFHFKKALNQFLHGLSKTETFLYEALYDGYHFYMVKSMITLYSKGFFTHEEMMLKLESYLRKTKAHTLLNHVSPNRVAV